MQWTVWNKRRTNGPKPHKDVILYYGHKYRVKYALEEDWSKYCDNGDSLSWAYMDEPLHLAEGELCSCVKRSRGRIEHQIKLKPEVKKKRKT